MGFEAALVLGLLTIAVVLFATERVPVDVVSLLMLCLLVALGVLTPAEGLQGFSDPATIAVAGMVVMSSGLAATGAVSRIPYMLAPLLRRNFYVGVAVMMLTVALTSAFVNNTACVAVFIPVCLGLSRLTRVSPSKLLMPLSFSAIFGGTCTLIGTSPNLVVSSFARNHGQPPFSMFEFTPLGLLVAFVGILYMLLIGIRLIPERRPAGELTRAFEMGDYLTEVVVLPDNPIVGKTLAQASVLQELDIDVVSIEREGEVFPVPPPGTVLHAEDILLVRCNVESLKNLQMQAQLTLKAESKVHDRDLRRRQAALVEVLVPPGSILVGQSLKSIDFRNRFGAVAIAIRHKGEEEVVHEKVGTVRIEAGDVLLIEVAGHLLPQLKRQRAFMVISESSVLRPQTRKMLSALGIFVAVVMASAFRLMAIEVGVIMGSLAMVLTRCLSLDAAYRALDWRLICLISGSLSLGKAMEKTGLAAFVAERMLQLLGDAGPAILLLGLYLVTSLLTEIISNTAAAALMAPLALASAGSVGMDPRPLLIAVTFACSSSFMTPIGYQTNTMIYAPGQYRAVDFMRVGAPLNLVIWLLCSLAIPWFWPLKG